MKRNFSKKVLCLVLCLFMMSSALLTSCVEDEADEDNGRTTRSIVLAMVSEKEVSSETEKMIEDALNAITKSKYKTMVDIRYYSQEEYFDEMVALIDRIKEDKENAKQNGGSSAGKVETGAVEEETVVDEFYGYAEYKYPEIKENQLDILLISGLDMYNYFTNTFEGRDWLAPLDSDLSMGAALLYDYIFPSYINSVGLASYETTYAIPNNVLTSEYTYLLVDKKLATKYQYAHEVPSWTSITDAESFISDIAKYETAVAPVYGMPVPTNIHSWTYEVGTMGDVVTYKNQPGKFSIFTASIKKDVTIETTLGFDKSLSSNYGRQLRVIQGLKENGYICTELAENQKFAVGFLNGNEGTISQYREDYEVIVLEKPRITTNDLYGYMFGVYAGSDNELSRNMDILMLINTDETVRNILQYGIEGVHYAIDEKTGILRRLNQDYVMDINKTGNVLIAHAEEGVDPETVEYMKLQLADANIYPAVAYCCNSEAGVLKDFIDAEIALSQKYEAKILACKTVAELDAVIEEFNNDQEISALYTSWFVGQEGEYSPYSAYYRWMVDMGYIVEE